MMIHKLMRGPILENGYVLYQRDGGSCYILDPGYNPEEYLSFLKVHDLRPLAILATHGHDDHIGGVPLLRESLGCPFCMQEKDRMLISFRPDRTLSEGDVFDLDGTTLRVLETPGHTQGSVCFADDAGHNLFSGDTLFDTDLGRTDLAGGSEEDLKRSVRGVLARIPDDWHIWPGHEGDCTMGFVRIHNEEFRAICAGKDRI